ncbi:unnamed protein product [Lactuca virosa]|uniref:Uncharacterized protein n=1 Tax=Lactuca virosa TaxID=75947 RepID=A0AAU9P5W0_9ASTR|nr:unnamed protein product [Lactuca virosa]
MLILVTVRSLPTSTTADNPGRKFRDKKKKKCDFWEWVDQDEELIKQDNTEVKISILENNFWTHKVKADKESMSFRKDLDKLN